jgi:hypothetical protein
MTHFPGPAETEDRSPPLSQDLGAVQVRYTRKLGDTSKPGSDSTPRASGELAQNPSPARAEAVDATPSSSDRIAALELQIRQYTAALEDIVTLALSNADYKERAIMMHRRAVAALSGIPPARRPDR